MQNNELLSFTGHRPYPPPATRWTMTQRWTELLFAHWPLPPEALGGRIPAGLELDLWEGQPWISVVPFRIDALRFRGFPASSRFLELNVRTYVTCNGKPGVFFFSLDAQSRPAVEAARRLFYLPYLYAKMSLRRESGWIHYECARTDRRGKPAVFSADYRPLSPEHRLAGPGTLEHWLTERYCLYSVNAEGAVHVGEIHHLPWQLQPAELRTRVNSMAASHDLALPDMEPVITYTEKLDVLLWPLRKLT